MTTEELLKPRWKVIADFPENPYCINQILHVFESKIFFESSGYHFNPNDYSAIFKKLEWWEERKVEDMPEYVKSIVNNAVHKVLQYKDSVVALSYENAPTNVQMFESICSLIPSTKEEYEKQK